MHFYDWRYPTASTALGMQPGTWVPADRAMASRLGLSRTLVMQPSAYRADNRCTLDGIRELGPGRARGVGVVDKTVSDAELGALTAGVIRGVRVTCCRTGRCPGAGSTEVDRHRS